MMAMIEIGNNMDFSEKFFFFILMPSLKILKIVIVKVNYNIKIDFFQVFVWEK